MEKRVTRSPKMWVDEGQAEIYTPEDYMKSKAFEVLLDAETHRMGIPNEIQNIPTLQEEEDAYDYLGLEASDGFALELPNLVQGCVRLSQSIFYSSLPCMSELERNSYLPTDKRELAQLKPFTEQVKYFSSRYVVEAVSIPRHLSGRYTLSDNYLQAMVSCRVALRDILNKVKGVFKNDIELYDNLFSYFDENKVQDEQHLEVYLGRDGIFAFYARLGETAAKGSINSEVQNVTEHPARLMYMVYSTSVRHEENSVKSEYIGQHFTDEDEPQFFDTGYRGTIPADILQLMGVSINEIDDRIHLLNSSGNKARRVRTQPDDASICFIEELPKPEESAHGLSINGGEVEYKTRANSLGEQLSHQIIRSMVIRHFWLKEHLKIKEKLDEIGIPPILPG